MLTQGQNTGEFILAEPEQLISREVVTVTVGAGEKLVSGRVLSKLSATSKYVPYDNAGTDGSEGAAGILYNEVDNTSGDAPADFKATALVRLCAVNKTALVWSDGVVDADKTAAYADLAAAFILAR
jgi:hypothetical protein